MAKSRQSGLRVLNDRVLIKPDKPEVQATGAVHEALTSGKLIVPDMYKAFYENLPETGVIVTFGPTCKNKFEIGSKVHFAKMAAAKLKHLGEDYLVLREHDVNFVIES